MDKATYRFLDGAESSATYGDGCVIWARSGAFECKPDGGERGWLVQVDTKAMTVDVALYESDDFAELVGPSSVTRAEWMVLNSVVEQAFEYVDELYVSDDQT